MGRASKKKMLNRQLAASAREASIARRFIMADVVEDIKKKQNPCSDEFPLGIGTNFNIKEEDINEFVKEEVDIPPISSDGADLGCGSNVPIHFITAPCHKCVMLEKKVMRLEEENKLLKESLAAKAVQESQHNTEHNTKTDGKMQGNSFSSILVPSPHERPFIREDLHMPSQNQGCSEFLLGKESNFIIKEEENKIYIKEEVEIPPFAFDEAASSSGSTKPAQFKMNMNIGTEKVEERRVKSKYQKQPIKFGIRNTKGAERFFLPPDDIYNDIPSSSLISSEPEKFFNDESFEKTNLDDSTKESKFPCPVCNKSFSTKYNLIYHSQIHSGKFNYFCQYCGKGFSARGNLVQHIRIHTGEKPYPCSECEEKFKVKSHLNKHLLIHTGKKPHQCLICKKRFSLSSYLVRHNSIHLKNKSFKCSFCDESFSCRVLRKKHIRIHTEEKRYQCSECGVRFDTKANLARHILIHTGEKPHQCLICKKRFSQSATLLGHNNSVHLKIKFKCSFCDKCFRRNCDLKFHERIHFEKLPTN